MILAYARVSTLAQDNDNQFHKIDEFARFKELSIDERVEEKIKSISQTRKVYEVVGKLKEGDTLIVAEMSRLGRSLSDLLSLIESLTTKKVRILFVREMLDICDDNPAGKLQMQILGAMAEYERAMIRQRTKDTIAAKRAAGIKVGRPHGAKNKTAKYEEHKDKILKDLKKGISKSKISTLYKMSRVTLDKALKEWEEITPDDN